MSTPTVEFDEHLSIFLSKKAHEYAMLFAAEQQTPAKGKRVYLNTLAVYAVHTYLRSVGIETDLESSHSWNTISRAILDHADLMLPGIGRIECCPVLPGETQFAPPALSRNTVAYVAVQFENELTAVKLLGYQPTLESERVSPVKIDSLYPLENLTDFLFRIYDALEFIENNPNDPNVQQLKALAEDGHSINEIVIRLEQKRKRPRTIKTDINNIFGVGKEKVPVLKTRNALNLSPDRGEDEEKAALTELGMNLLKKFNELWED